MKSQYFIKANYQSALILSAYLLVIIIWSTTPLAIKWSSQGLDFITGLSARMLIGAVIALILCLCWYRHFPLNKKALMVYSISSLSIFGSMMLVYYGAQFISSGLISVLFGLSPLVTSWLAMQLFASEKLSPEKLIGACLGVVGLYTIFKQQLNLGEQAIIGIFCILVAVIFHSLSAIWIKQIKIQLPALVITTGGLVFSIPLLLISYVVFAQPLPETIPQRTLYAIVYLGIMGSVVGFVSYYFVLAKLEASTVALITLITPICALLIGEVFNGEKISNQVWFGTAIILFGLIIHQLSQWRNMYKLRKET